MTLQVGDKTVVIPLRDGGRVAVRSGTLSVGDKAVLIPGANGQIYAVRPASPQVGDKVILYPLQGGGYACLASVPDDEGGSGGTTPVVKPPANFSARRTGPGTADLRWTLNEGNTAVRIVRRPDRYPTAINDGTVAYEGDGYKIEDHGLDGRYPYYYCAWGKAGSKYSNGYLMAVVGAWGSQSDPVHVCDAWSRAVKYKGEQVDVGTYTYTWDGQGRVYISASPLSAQKVRPDDGMIVTANGLSIQTGNLWTIGGGIVEITSIMRPGINYVSITISDIEDVLIGTETPLYIMRTL